MKVRDTMPTQARTGHVLQQLHVLSEVDAKIGLKVLQGMQRPNSNMLSAFPTLLLRHCCCCFLLTSLSKSVMLDCFEYTLSFTLSCC